MCVAILQKTGKELTPAQLYSGWMKNQDGGGLAYMDSEGKVAIRAGYLKFNDFENAYRDTVKNFGKNGPMLVHMRIRSTGGMGAKNCHPFKIKNGAMIHNGTMFHPESRANETDHKSDTRIFAERFHNILDLDSVKKAEAGILRTVGEFNKLVFLYDGGEYHIMNETKGYWDDGIWFSNPSCKVSSSYPARVVT